MHILNCTDSQPISEVQSLKNCDFTKSKVIQKHKESKVEVLRRIKKTAPF